jgi:hypothetical protein
VHRTPGWNGNLFFHISLDVGSFTWNGHFAEYYFYFSTDLKNLTDDLHP